MDNGIKGKMMRGTVFHDENRELAIPGQNREMSGGTKFYLELNFTRHRNPIV